MYQRLMIRNSEADHQTAIPLLCVTPLGTARGYFSPCHVLQFSTVGFSRQWIWSECNGSVTQGKTCPRIADNCTQLCANAVELCQFCNILCLPTGCSVRSARTPEGDSTLPATNPLRPFGPPPLALQGAADKAPPADLNSDPPAPLRPAPPFRKGRHERAAALRPATSFRKERHGAAKVSLAFQIYIWYAQITISSILDYHVL